MNKHKLNKYRILKKRHVFPRIVGAIFILVLFFSLAFAVAYLFIQNVIGNKFMEGYKQTRRVVGIIEEEDNDYYLLRQLYEYTSLNDSVKALQIVDKDYNELVSFGASTPDFSRQIDFNLDSFTITDSEKLTIIPEVQISVRDEGFTVDLRNFISMEDIRDLYRPRKITLSLLSSDWKSLGCWFIVDIGNDGEKLCLESNIGITYYEIYIISIAFYLVIILSSIFCLYQLVELIKVFADQRRAYFILHTDVVTGGHNRLYFNEEGNKLLRKNRGRKYAVVRIRYDKFRSFCVYYGERKGEELLENICDALDKNINKKEITAHIEGADFGLILRYEDEAALNARVENMMEAIRNIKPEIRMYISAGVADSSDSNDVTQLYTEAGIAGGSAGDESEINRIIWFNEEMKAARIWEHKVENDMYPALERHEFQVYLQPKYDTKSEVLSGAEALVRWIHPTEGFVPPGRFVPIFEKNGFVLKLDDYMLTEVAKLQAGWLSEGKQIVPISVNVSRAHFTREDLAEHICEIVDIYKVPHQYIELELTESAFFDDKEVLLNTVNKMKQYGFHVSMDDFGAGYSSLNSLKELPLDVIKLDAEFFRNADDLDRANLIVSRTIGLAKQLGMVIVAEGIETREQVDFLAGQDCDLIQGYYFAKPMPVGEFENKAFGVEEKKDEE